MGRETDALNPNRSDQRTGLRRGQMHLPSVLGKVATRAFRPLHYDDLRTLAQLLPTQLPQLSGLAEPKEIEVHHLDFIPGRISEE